MSRSIFEEVGDQRRDAPVAGAADAAKRRNRRIIAVWLLILAAMVVAQILVGGLTRLTDSGLSMVEWRIHGFAPPTSEAGWLTEFEKYQTTTEYQEQNYDMTLSEFKSIYWWEWGHRTWGRAIGLAFLIPFGFFLWRGMTPTGWTGRLLLVGGLGGLQGLIGWWMVASGLTGRVDVSQYRLAVHLGLAFIIVGMLLWYALSLRREEWELLQARRRREKGLFIFAAIMTAVLFVQIILGAFVAGLKAWDYGDWPTMGNALFPPGEPFIPFEEKAATQFLHRKAAYLAILVGVAFWWRARRSTYAASRLWANVVVGLLAAQVVVGIVTLTEGVPLHLASMHQALAVLLFAAMIRAKHQMAFPAEQKIA